MSWLKNATLLLSTSTTTQSIPANLVTRHTFGGRPEHANEIPDDNDAIIVDAEVTELIQTTATAGNAQTLVSRKLFLICPQ